MGTVRWGEARSDRVVRSLGYNSRSAHRGRLRSGVSKRRVESELCACVDPIPVCEAERSCAAAGEGRSGGFAYRTAWHAVRVCVRLREPTPPLSIRVQREYRLYVRHTPVACAL